MQWLHIPEQLHHKSHDVLPACCCCWVRGAPGCTVCLKHSRPVVPCPGTCAGIPAPVLGLRSASSFYNFKLKGRMTY